MHSDRQNNPLTGASSEAAEHFDAALRAFNIYRGDPVAMADSAIAAAPDFAMAHILKAYLFALATEPEAAAEARAIVATTKLLAATDRERSHIAALDCLLAGNWTEAALRLDHHNMAFPHDLLGLQAGHLMDFYRANARNLRDRLARALPKWSEDMPGYAALLGMYAFGLEETGDYARAEAMGREAVARDPLDCWAHHAVAHVLEMQGRTEDGLAWMDTREPHWSGDDNFFKVHNWWHKALYHLDLGQSGEVIALYDARIRGDASPVALDLVDASALLWRMHLEGHDVGPRWDEVAAAWDAHADGKLYPFNDWHAAMAYLGADRSGEVDRIVGAYRSAEPDWTETAGWARETGLPLIEGFRAFWQGRYADSAEHLHAARFIANSYGGSHAQRDIIDWTLTEALLRGGNTGGAEALAGERLALKPHSPVNRRFLNRARAAEPAPTRAA
ncbi:tetratricopeptide repeat protein [Paralimibaculum aggregatum]|uniref:Tetratricopeptide repeat protein 38 n=1 Tax=Paralimibaculum aggregatum TaxID=3036245 RepID=A0ABQ6LS56_9RHOB|nr:tetratricopeptide repeat protein [Limibaculum sp. NKW23]GMG84490.1 tetratricopeptide repeat protein [Limibaculum sp. NKW23]